MRTLVVGAGAIGGVVATRLLAVGGEVAVATRNEATADTIRRTGMQVTGAGGQASVTVTTIAPLDAYTRADAFDLIVLVTKAREACDLAPTLGTMLSQDGVIYPLQNGGVSQLIAQAVPGGRVLGGLSNLGATMVSPGVYEQRNAGYLVVGELRGGVSPRVERVAAWLRRGIDVRTSGNMTGAIWSKLIVNCSVTTLGAVAGRTMRGYIDEPCGLPLFDAAYREALSVARAAGVEVERMLIEPEPPPRTERSNSVAYDAWLATVLAGYGDIKPSMLQDFERGRVTEIDVINGFVAAQGAALGVPTPVNTAIVETVHAITRGELAPSPDLLRWTWARAIALSRSGGSVAVNG